MKETKKLDEATIKKLKEGYLVSDPWIIRLPFLDPIIILFGDYLRSMETFIETEMQERLREYETVHEGWLKSDVPPTPSIEGYELEIVENFRHSLKIMW